MHLLQAYISYRHAACIFLTVHLLEAYALQAALWLTRPIYCGKAKWQVTAKNDPPESARVIGVEGGRREQKAAAKGVRFGAHFTQVYRFSVRCV
jgi:hypothetical protein